MNNVTLRVAMTFVAPDANTVAMSAVPDLMDTGLEGAHLDREIGLRVTPVAQVSMLNEETGEVMRSMFLTQEELARAITEMRAIHDSMPECLEIVDRGWQRYRDAIRTRVMKEDGR